MAGGGKGNNGQKKKGKSFLLSTEGHACPSSREVLFLGGLEKEEEGGSTVRRETRGGIVYWARARKAFTGYLQRDCTSPTMGKKTAKIANEERLRNRCRGGIALRHGRVCLKIERVWGGPPEEKNGVGDQNAERRKNNNRKRDGRDWLLLLIVVELPQSGRSRQQNH